MKCSPNDYRFTVKIHGKCERSLNLSLAIEVDIAILQTIRAQISCLNIPFKALLFAVLASVGGCKLALGSQPTTVYIQGQHAKKAANAETSKKAAAAVNSKVAKEGTRIMHGTRSEGITKEC